MAWSRQSVRSSNIAAIGYDDENNILEVVFKGGGTYWYEGVPPILFEALQQTSSVGKLLNEAIKKGSYNFRKVSGTAPQAGSEPKRSPAQPTQ